MLKRVWHFTLGFGNEMVTRTEQMKNSKRDIYYFQGQQITRKDMI